MCCVTLGQLCDLGVPTCDGVVAAILHLRRLLVPGGGFGVWLRSTLKSSTVSEASYVKHLKRLRTGESSMVPGGTHSILLINSGN